MDANELMTGKVKDVEPQNVSFSDNLCVEEPNEEWLGAMRSQTQAKDDEDTARESTNAAITTKAWCLLLSFSFRFL